MTEPEQQTAFPRKFHTGLESEWAGGSYQVMEEYVQKEMKDKSK